LKKLFTYLLILLTLTAFSLKAQQLPLLSQYMFNGFLVNPAVAGVDGYTSITLTAREQWLGLVDAPKTEIIAFQSRLYTANHVKRTKSVWRNFTKPLRNGKVGIGGYLYNDKNGLIDRTGGQFTYAYHIRLQSSQLSFGVSATMYQFSIDKNKINLESNQDALVNTSDLNMFIPDFNFGVYYSTKNYYAGFSISQLAQSSMQLSNENASKYKLYRHYYLTGGYKVDVNDDIVIVPSILIKSTNQLASQVDISGKIYFRDDYYAGLSFRTGSAFVIMGGVTVDKFTFGYAFDYNLNAIRKHSFGSHEVMAALRFGDTARKYRWINRN